ncbi:MAG: hypothetical protein AAF810_21375 [Cyanobacteria bacterium P01_D01_bin.36]
MRVWFTAFVVLFVAIELLDWIGQMGSVQPSGIWLLLGGMGLAVLSNAAHWPKNSATKAQTNAQSKTDHAEASTADADAPVAEVSAGKRQKIEPLVDRSTKDSISFKVRPLKR